MDIFHFLLYAIILIVVDVVWLSQFGPYFMKENGLTKINKTYGAITYVIMAIGFYYFLVGDEKEKPDYLKALLLGLLVYGVYDFTSLSLQTTTKLDVAIMDMCWGGSLSVITLFLYSLCL